MAGLTVSVDKADGEGSVSDAAVLLAATAWGRAWRLALGGSLGRLLDILLHMPYISRCLGNFETLHLTLCLGNYETLHLTLCSLNYDALHLTRCGESPRRIVIVIVTTNCKVWVVLGSKRARSLNPSIPSTNHDVVLFDFDGGLVVWWSGRLVLSSWKGRGRAEDGRIGFNPVALPRRSATALEQFGPAWLVLGLSGTGLGRVGPAEGHHTSNPPFHLTTHLPQAWWRVCAAAQLDKLRSYFSTLGR